jgi:hypothetical protein
MTAMNTYRQSAPPVVASWFAYLVGFAILIASAAVVYEVVRMEIALGKADDVLGKPTTKQR